MTDQECITLSQIIRRRYRCVRDAGVDFSDGPSYDRAFWGVPWDWDVLPTMGTCSVANILFPLTEALIHPEIPTSGISRSYFDVVDGYFRQYIHSNDPQDSWEKGKEGHIGGRIQYSGERLCVVAREDEDVQLEDRIKKDWKRHQVDVFTRRRFPDMMGVQLHADLTWKEMRLALRLRGEEEYREILLPAWGMRSWYEECIAKGEQFIKRHKIIPDSEMVKEYLYTKVCKPRSVGDEFMELSLEELQLGKYVKLLANIVPRLGKGISVRFTGWFSMGAFHEAMKEVEFQTRFAARIDTEPSYMYIQYDTENR